MRVEGEQRLSAAKAQLEQLKHEDESLKAEIIDMERKIAKANLEIDKVNNSTISLSMSIIYVVHQ